MAEVVDVSEDPRPFVRVVVLNWNSAWYTRRCIEALHRTEYPADRFEVVLVDNGSVDGSIERLRAWFPELSIVANGANLGFAEGCNRGMRDRDGVDAVALINNDTVVDPGWLTPLVESFVVDPSNGAASARLVLEPGFVPVDVDADGDVGIRQVGTDGVDVTDALRFEGFESVSDAAWPLAVTYRLRSGRGRIWVPAGPQVSEIAMVFDAPAHVASTGGAVTAGDGGREATIRVDSGRIDLLNGIGTGRNSRCEGYDRHFGVPEGELDEEMQAVIDVQGVCGGGALLRSTMLDEVGLLDPRLFAYYEDTDLSWRASRAGWRVVAVPASRVAHAFGAAGGSRAAGFFHLDRRNWWLTAERNGTDEERRTVRREVRREMWTAVRANTAGRIKRRRAPSLLLIGAWLRILADHRIELTRRDHPSRGLPGVRPTRSVVGRFQPRPLPGVPAPRPWGPVPVRVDITDITGITDITAPAACRPVSTGWDEVARASGRHLVAALLQEHPELDVVPVVGDGGGNVHVAGPAQVADLLGTATVGTTPKDEAIRLQPPVAGVVLRLTSQPGGPTVLQSAGVATVEVGPDQDAAVVAATIIEANRCSGPDRRARG